VPDPRGPAPVTLGAPYGDDDLSGEPRRIPRLVGSWGSRAAKCVTGPRHLSQRDRGRHRAERAPWRDAHLPPGFPALCDEREPGRVRYAPRELRQQAVVPERVAGASPGDLHPRTPPPQEPPADFRPRVRGRALRALPVGGRTKIRLAEGFETQLQRPLPYALAQARTLELADFAVALRDLDHPVGWRVRGSGSPLVPSGREELLQPFGLKGRTGAALAPRDSALPVGLRVGLWEGVALCHVANEPPDPRRWR
jgi:hypothetical protein